jgi:hypothetical protein
MKIPRSLTACFLVAAFAGCTGLVIHGEHRIAKEQGVRDGANTRIVPATSEARSLREVFYGCSTERDYKRRVAVTTCKIKYEK